MSPVSPLLRKEIRLLLPSFVVAMVLAVAPFWLPGGLIPEEAMEDIALIAFGIGAVFLAVTPFGQEFSAGTFSMLLAQPLPRSRVWDVKTGLTAAALLVSTVAFTVSRHIFVSTFCYYDRGFWDRRWVGKMDALCRAWNWDGSAAAGFMIALIVLAGGLWTTLLFRQIGPAIFFTVVTPLAIVVAAGFVGQHVDIELSPTLLLISYAVIAILWARRAFLRAEDTQRLRQTVSISSLRQVSPMRTDVSGARSLKPLRAMLARELMLHQVTLLVGCGLLLFHLGALGLRWVSAVPNSWARWVLETAPFLWLFLPWLIGSVAVAEERNQGTLEGQLCLPVTRRRQWAIKLLMVVALGVLLGAVAPWAIEVVAIGFHIPSGLLTEGGRIVQRYWALGQDAGMVFVSISALAVASAFLAFFWSTAARQTLPALAAAAAAAPVLVALFGWMLMETGPARTLFLWKGPLLISIGLPVLISVMVALSFANYRRVVADRSLWIRTVAICNVALLFAGIATAFIYPRPWERLMSLEPPAGPSRLRGMMMPKICRGEGSLLFVLLPDGRIWETTEFPIENPLSQPSSGRFLEKTNWIDIACGRHVAALHSDGSLWMTQYFGGGGSPDLQRVGADTDWKEVASINRELLALKADGSVWVWNLEAYLILVSFGAIEDSKPDPAARTFAEKHEPVRVGTEFDLRAIRHRASAGGILLPNGGIAARPDVPLAGFSAPLSRRSDWIAAMYSADPPIVLAADGALCAWRNVSYWSEFLGPTRRPLWCVNVLAGPEAAGVTGQKTAR